MQWVARDRPPILLNKLAVGLSFSASTLLLSLRDRPVNSVRRVGSWVVFWAYIPASEFARSHSLIRPVDEGDRGSPIHFTF